MYKMWSRSAWTESRLEFRQPRELSISTRLCDCASTGEITAAIAAVQQTWRSLRRRIQEAGCHVG
jgi:hypothetical protein